MTHSTRVVVAMSGGVDSSVAAALLVRAGYEVVGLMMRLWSEPGGAAAHNRCCTPDALALARRVAAQLDIPFYSVDAKAPFKSEVVDFFVDGYASGITPNPCVECNRHIRWDFLLNKALDLGASHLATGHYARVRNAGGEFQLLRAVDDRKDQSYVLSVMGQSQLQHALFPVGDHTKDEVRNLAREFSLPVADRSDSQDLCFLGDGDYRAFLKRRAPQAMKPGPIVDTTGARVGRHSGLAAYTIGQRKGLGIAAPTPLYVLDTDTRANALIVGPREALGCATLKAHQFIWVSGHAPSEPFRAQVKIRYRAQPAPATVAPEGADRVDIQFEQDQRDITPGQAAVVYTGDVCLGGGIIQR